MTEEEQLNMAIAASMGNGSSASSSSFESTKDSSDDGLATQTRPEIPLLEESTQSKTETGNKEKKKS